MDLNQGQTKTGFTLTDPVIIMITMIIIVMTMMIIMLTTIIIITPIIIVMTMMVITIIIIIMVRGILLFSEERSLLTSFIRDFNIVLHFNTFGKTISFLEKSRNFNKSNTIRKNNNVNK